MAPPPAPLRGFEAPSRALRWPRGGGQRRPREHKGGGGGGGPGQSRPPHHGAGLRLPRPGRSAEPGAGARGSGPASHPPGRAPWGPAPRRSRLSSALVRVSGSASPCPRLRVRVSGSASPGPRLRVRSVSGPLLPAAPEMPAPAPGLLLALAALCCAPGAPGAPGAATLNTLLLHSNAIKNGPSGPGGGGGGPVWAVSAAPGAGVPQERPHGYLHVENKHQQHFMCVDDKDCGLEEYCDSGPRGGGGPGGGPGVQICLPCRKRRRRCQRTVMCCPGNYCSNGLCVPIDQNHLHAIEMDEMTTEPVNNDHSLLENQPRRTTPSARTKGQEGAVCLRSSDCSDGLCCARHFWSKICKPVLKEGQVCTKHRRKGSHGLEIFQRCFCADGLTCRVQKDHLTNNASRLHTCQKH
ncbi:dickkopf-related protein 1 [Macrotis lagotis]|uniref:dickkopf-related protein 1 n=1 Tax=Macrotis lagotis TaxID=92651 RepID=UPI003D68D81E